MAENQTTKMFKLVKDLTGQRFGRLAVVDYAGTNGNQKATWQCRCDCGQTTIALGKDLRNGHTQSCGCWRRDTCGDRARLHGMKHTPEYKSWQHAKERCYKPNNKAYSNYGARGIVMCQEWLNSFEAFYAHIGPRPNGCSLDRVDNEKGYAPGNVRWATRSEQNNNRRPRRWFRRPAIKLDQ